MAKHAARNNWLLDPNYPMVGYPGEPVIFDELQREYWEKHFQKKSAAELKETLVALGKHPGKTRQINVGKLVSYFRKLVD